MIWWVGTEGMDSRVLTCPESFQINEIQMVSLETTIKWVIDDGGSVVWPLETKRAFLVKFPSILIWNIMWHPIYWYAGRTLPTLISSTERAPFSNEIITLAIYLWIASYQKLVPHRLINLQEFFDCLGNPDSKIVGFLQYLALNLEMIWSFRHSNYLTHHLNKGSSCNWLDTANSASTMGLECFKSNKSNHSDDPLLHSTCKVQPLVVFFAYTLTDLFVRKPSNLLIAD